MKQNEYQEQCAVFDWAALQSKKYPELALLFAVPNGLRLPIGLAVKAKKQGVKAGVPDMVLPVARMKFHGLFIEMKVKGGKVKPEQLQWHKDLIAQDYCVWVCWTQESAKEVLLAYLDSRIEQAL